MPRSLCAAWGSPLRAKRSSASSSSSSTPHAPLPRASSTSSSPSPRATCHRRSRPVGSPPTSSPASTARRDRPFGGRCAYPPTPTGTSTTTPCSACSSTPSPTAPSTRSATTRGKMSRACSARLYAYWGAVADVFPEAWALAPEAVTPHARGGAHRHGVCHGRHRRRPPTIRSGGRSAEFLPALHALAPHCQWTSGVWKFGPGQQRRWNEIQNVGADIHLLTYHLLRLLPARSSPATMQTDKDGWEGIDRKPQPCTAAPR